MPVYDNINCMMIIEKELNCVKKELLNGFKEPVSIKILEPFITNGSKLIRSSLALLYLKAQNIEITNDIYKIIATGEIIHNASLLHDDVIDNAELRRGKITIAKEFSSTISILSGDYLLSYAIEKLLELKNFEILEIFKSCTQNMTKAEFKQHFLKNNLPTENEYIEICKGKTATLFSSILESTAILSKINSEKAKHFGEIFGIFFQIKNDLAKDSSIIDIKNGIKTAKDILGIEKTKSLLDNYKEEMSNLIKDFPNNDYKKDLEDLIRSL